MVHNFELKIKSISLKTKVKERFYFFGGIFPFFLDFKIFNVNKSSLLYITSFHICILYLLAKTIYKIWEKVQVEAPLTPMHIKP
jgi:hypothetical protein